MSKPQRQKAGVKSASSQLAADLVAGRSLVSFDALAVSEPTIVEESEDIILLKKLTKRDSSTREKALRELYERTVEEKKDSVLATFTHISRVLDKLAFDCAPIVRQLTMRLLSKQITLLRKKAEKQLWDVLPWVFLSTCDTNNATSSEATSLLSCNFTDEKISSALVALTPRLVCIIKEVVDGNSSLLVPSKLLSNEEEDCADSRKIRICEQVIDMLARILEKTKSEEARRMLVEILKKEVKSSGPMSRSSMLAILSCGDSTFVVPPAISSRLLIPFHSPSPSSSSLLGPSSDVLLLLFRNPQFNLSSADFNKMTNIILSAIKKFSRLEWTTMGHRILPLLSSFTSFHSVDPSKRSQLISSLFKSLQETVNLCPQSVQATVDCIQFIFALLEGPSEEEKAIATLSSLNLVEMAASNSQFVSNVHSLFCWLILRLDEDKKKIFLEESIRRMTDRLPSSSNLLYSLLSSHIPSLLFWWPILVKCTYHLPLHILTSADDTTLLSVHSSIDVLSQIEECASSSLAPLYLHLLSIVPSSSHPTHQLAVSPLVTYLLSHDPLPLSLLPRVSSTARMEALSHWAQNDEVCKTVRMINCLPDERHVIGAQLLDIPHANPLTFLAHLAQECDMDQSFYSEVANRALNTLLTFSPKDLEDYSLPPTVSQLICSLDASSVYSSIISAISKKDLHLDLRLLRPFASFLFSIDSSLPLITADIVLPEMASLIRTVETELNEEALLYSFWPPSSSLTTCTPSSLSFDERLCVLWKRLSFSLTLYSCRPEGAHSCLLLVHVATLSSCLALSSQSIRSLVPFNCGEEELLSLSSEMIESACSSLDTVSLVSLLCSPSLYPLNPLIVHSLRPLCRLVKPSSLPSQFNLPFSSFPQVSSHLEFARQLYYGRPAALVVRNIMMYSKEEGVEELFTLRGSSNAVFVSITALNAGSVSLRDGDTLTSDCIDFLLCAIVTSLTSVNEENREGNTKWKERNRKVLATAALQLAIQAHNNSHVVGDEWNDFFLPTIISFALKMYAEIDPNIGCSLTRILNLFILSLDKLEWIEGTGRDWNGETIVMNQVLDEEGVSPPIQSIFLRAHQSLRSSHEMRPEMIASASKCISLCARECLSIDEGEEGMTIRPPPFLKRLACEDDGWCRTACVAACVCLVSSQQGEERCLLSDSIAPSFSRAISFVVSRAEEWPECWKEDVYTKKYGDRVFLCGWISHLVRDAFSSFPSTVMTWYTGLPKSAHDMVLNFVASGLSRVLVDRELSEVMNGGLIEKFKNDQATLNVRRHLNELHLEYIMEDTKMRLHVIIPQGWPLISPCVHVEGAIVGEVDSRRWMLSLKSQLYRNCSLIVALSSWLRLAGKKVEGADACTICMQLVAPQTKQLPKARCRTCNNKFHSSCLYKWFDSSNQSTCPLCRTDFTAPP